MDLRFGDFLFFGSIGFALAQLFIVFLFDIRHAMLALVLALAMVMIGFGMRVVANRLTP